MSLRDQAIALAGVSQAAFLVDQVARTGNLDREVAAASIDSLFRFDADTAADIYGGVASLRVGIVTLKGLLQRKLDRQQQEQLRYFMGMLYLQRKLQPRTDMLQVIRRRLEHAAHHGEHFTDDDDNIVAAVASIYQDTISTFAFRIQVTGEAVHLQQERNAERVRALLLAGIRAATLWRQSGGKRWRLMLQRNALLAQVEQITAEFTVN
ncbi:MAG: high frequency lysogenization protein HflD [Planctomycetota bacterium]|jgi:high frequency lysogenization protein